MQGHFQILLKQCPLIQLKLGLFDRIMYCSGCLSYAVGAVSTPMFVAIPVLTILIGALPVAFSAPQWMYYAFAFGRTRRQQGDERMFSLSAAGMFPVVITANLKKAITTYAVASHLLLYYIRGGR